MVDHETEIEFGADPDEPEGVVIPFPRMRQSPRVADAWGAAVEKFNRDHRRRHVLPSPLDVVPSLIRKRALPAMPWPASWPEIGSRCRTYVGECVSVTAAIGAGKTSFALQTGIAVAAAGFPVLDVKLELDPEQGDLRIVANMHGASMGAVREEWSEERIRHSLSAVADLWHYVDHYDDPDEQFQAIDDAIAIAWEIYRLPPFVIVDHLGELVAEERDDRAALRRWAHRFRKLALRTNSWIMLLNQVSKGNQAATTGRVDFDAAADAMGIEMGSQAIASAVANSIVLNVFKADDAMELDAHALIPKARNTGREGRVGMRFAKLGGRWSELDYLPATPGAAKAAAEADKRDKHRAAPPRTPAQARIDLNSAIAGDAAASRRVAILDAIRRHGMLGMEMTQIRKIRGAGRGHAVQQALQELERAGSVERITGNKWRALIGVGA